MKNIIICCDGTSNDFGQRNSNVPKLFSLLKKDKEKQVVYYDTGVGTTSTYDAFNPITRKLQYGLGNGFGYGLSKNIKDAYLFLMKVYEKGDRIYMFGFSRGAYTVRAIAGLVTTCGLLHPNSQNLIPEALRIYFDRENPSTEDFKATFGRNCPIHFLGLWDTVTSVGWIYNPLRLQATTHNDGVDNVRHAISLDERRAFFRQNLWGKKQKESQDVKQVWFAGVHSDIGGSYLREESGLSNISLEWMLVEAMEKGLLIEDIERAYAMVNEVPNPHLQDQHESLKGFWKVLEYLPKIISVRRKSPKTGRRKQLYFNKSRPRLIGGKSLVHESVFLRLAHREDYRPANLLKSWKIDSIEKRYQVETWRRLEDKGSPESF